MVLRGCVPGADRGVGFRWLHSQCRSPRRRDEAVEACHHVDRSAQRRRGGVAGSDPRRRDFPHRIPAAAPTWTLPQMLWLKKNEPETMGRVARILFVKDYVRYLMTGEACTDHIEAQGTLFFDVAHRRWSPELCALAGVPFPPFRTWWSPPLSRGGFQDKPRPRPDCWPERPLFAAVPTARWRRTPQAQSRWVSVSSSSRLRAM